MIMENYLKKVSDIALNYNEKGNYIYARANFEIDYSNSPIKDIVTYIVLSVFSDNDWKNITGIPHREWLHSIPTLENPKPIFKFVLPTIIFIKDNIVYDDAAMKLLAYKVLRQKAIKVQNSINDIIIKKISCSMKFILKMNEINTQKIDMNNTEEFNKHIQYL